MVTATTDLDDGYRPETSLADAEDEIEEDAGARAVAEDPEFSGDDAHPPT